MIDYKIRCLELAQVGEKSLDRTSNPDAVIKRAEAYYGFLDISVPLVPEVKFSKKEKLSVPED